MRSRVEAERAGRADRRFPLSPKRTLSRPLSLIIAALTGAAAALAAAAVAVALLAVPAAHAGTPTRTSGLGRAAGSQAALIPTPVITGAHLTIVLRHGAVARPLIRLDSAASARARYARQTARKMLGHYGWRAAQFTPLNSLWNRESGWNKYAANPYSSAYGIPQAVPGSKMASAGPDWQTNATTQIRWGLRYIKSRYGSPAAAWAHELAYGWY
jgi:energy-converting hydrogenase Eha subunit A